MKTNLFILFIAFSTSMISQVGIGTLTPQGQLDIVSTNTGLVVPRVANIENVRTPDGALAIDGTIVFDIGRDALCYRISGKWVCMEIDDSGNAGLNVVDIIYDEITNYVKASNTDNSDEFGHSVCLSSDGSRLAVGAWSEDSNAIGIGGDQSDNSSSSSGAVYVFQRNITSWTQKSYVKASNTNNSDKFGHDVSLTETGDILVVSSQQEDSNATGVNGDQNDNSLNNAGAVYIVE